MKVTQPYEQAAMDARAAIDVIAASSDPILVGPWLGEIGYELLYWIPFVRWAIHHGAIARERLWVVSRGGCRDWYADLSDHYLDVFDWFTPEQFRAHNRARIDAQGAHWKKLSLHPGTQTAKQHEVSDFDRLLAKHAAVVIGSQPILLHPKVMYRLLRPYWRRRGPNLYDEHMHPRPFPKPAKPAGLPDDYVAMKFYTSSACPDTRQQRSQVATVIKSVLETRDVIVFDDGTVYDEHGEFTCGHHPRVTRVPLTPATNLATQTAVIAHASAFVGTYGGFAYLAPLLGVPTMAFYADRNFRDDHLRLAVRLFRESRVRFDVRDLRAVTLQRWTYAA